MFTRNTVNLAIASLIDASETLANDASNQSYHKNKLEDLHQQAMHIQAISNWITEYYNNMAKTQPILQKQVRKLVSDYESDKELV